MSRNVAISFGLLLASLSLPHDAQAAFIDSRAALGGSPLTIPAVERFGGGPYTGPGYTWSSTNESDQHGASFGSTAEYTFEDGTSWRDTPMAGVNSSSDAFSSVHSMSFTFDTLLSGIGGDIDWVSNERPVTIATYGVSGNLLETVTLSVDGSNVLTPNSFYGFKDANADIKSFVLTDGYIGIRNIDAVGLSPVPLPASAALFGGALLVLAAVGFGMARLKPETGKAVAAEG